jgi:hypothetical protein
MFSLGPVKASKTPVSTIYAVDGAKGNDGSLNNLLELMDGDARATYVRSSAPVMVAKSKRY